MNEILETWTPPEVLEKYFSFGRFGTDKFNCPGIKFNEIEKIMFLLIFFLWKLIKVFISAQGKMDLKGVLQSVTKKDVCIIDLLI